MWLIANWKSILAVIATAGICYLLHAVDVDRIEAAQRAAIEAQKTSDIQTCATAQNITKGVDNDLSSKISGLDADYLAAINRVREQSSANNDPTTASGVNHGTALPAIHACTNGISSRKLLLFSKDAEHYRLQLGDCQSFITKTWAANNQPIEAAQ